MSRITFIAYCCTVLIVALAWQAAAAPIDPALHEMLAAAQAASAAPPAAPVHAPARSAPTKAQQEAETVRIIAAAAAAAAHKRHKEERHPPKAADPTGPPREIITGIVGVAVFFGALSIWFNPCCKEDREDGDAQGKNEGGKPLGHFGA